ncbi:MAG TPA: tRNA 2-thiouridine(34) synthase MnmA [Aquihabitans sp.]|nr:tRNA 2-thiouridine(34) synthase MnmA [Aquihabitans sp.]
MKVLAMMSGGVDSSVAAALLRDEGHDVVGVTLKLWGGASDSGCCSVSDVDDARRAADALGLVHHVFDLSDDFTRHVVAPYAADHRAGRTPNPCIECNRHLKFAAVLERASLLGFDAVATGHHARVAPGPGGRRRIARGADVAKDQSYVLHVLGQQELARTLLPLGTLTKPEVRRRAAALGLRTATKPDSQDVCFITRTSGRRAFLGERIELTPGRVVDVDGATLGEVAAVELVTVGQRRGLGLAGGSAPRYVLDVDLPTATVTVGEQGDLLVAQQRVAELRWSDGVVGGALLAQCSAHGAPRPVTVEEDGEGGALLRWARPERRVAPGQSVVLYEGDEVVAGARAC